MKEYPQHEEQSNMLHDDGGEDLWALAEHEKRKRNLNRNDEEKFNVMIRLMRIGKMLSSAKITHKKIED